MAVALRHFIMPTRLYNFVMPVRQVAFVMPERVGATEGMTVSKNPQEVVDVSYSFATHLPAGASISSGVVYASRVGTLALPDEASTLAANAAGDATTVDLSLNPGIGAFFRINPGQPTGEQMLVTNVSGSGPFTATINPALTLAHLATEPCTFEPGVGVQVLEGPVQVVDGDKFWFRTKRGVSNRLYHLWLLATLNTGLVLRGELTLQLTEE